MDTFQHCECRNQKKWTEPVLIDIQPRSWGLLPTDLIVHLPKMKNEKFYITFWFGNLARIFHFINSTKDDTPIDVVGAFLLKH